MEASTWVSPQSFTDRPLVAVLVGVPGVIVSPFLLLVCVAVARGELFQTLTRAVAPGWGPFHAVGTAIASRVLGFRLVMHYVKRVQVAVSVTIEYPPRLFCPRPPRCVLQLVCSLSWPGVHGV